MSINCLENYYKVPTWWGLMIDYTVDFDLKCLAASETYDEIYPSNYINLNV